MSSRVTVGWGLVNSGQSQGTHAWTGRCDVEREIPRSVVPKGKNFAQYSVLDLYMSIESPPLAKLKPPDCAGPLAPKPKVPLGPVGCAIPSSAFSSSSEKYFSKML